MSSSANLLDTKECNIPLQKVENEGFSKRKEERGEKRVLPRFPSIASSSGQESKHLWSVYLSVSREEIFVAAVISINIAPPDRFLSRPILVLKSPKQHQLPIITLPPEPAHKSSTVFSSLKLWSGFSQTCLQLSSLELTRKVSNADAVAPVTPQLLLRRPRKSVELLCAIPDISTKQQMDKLKIKDSRQTSSPEIQSSSQTSWIIEFPSPSKEFGDSVHTLKMIQAKMQQQQQLFRDLHFGKAEHSISVSTLYQQLKEAQRDQPTRLE
ncbi:hypothetical protein TSAR_009093 [Trichomalopsis sarcophagae]|uniref:Uncharacterized protein n=1 Tax=Trichomalopsis sarcophagae TaxID=543379 RepID=A0A232FFZ1_9HYME|nr:hypothetical protein TSAR_009093 [Trichomalopsis sarcophagae]